MIRIIQKAYLTYLRTNLHGLNLLVNLDLQLVRVLLVRNNITAALANAVRCLEHELVSVLKRPLMLLMTLI